MSNRSSTRSPRRSSASKYIKRDPRRSRFPLPNGIWALKLRPAEFVILSYLHYRYCHPEGMRSYLAAAEEHGVLPMFYLELTSGLRKGELVALLWTDLDAERGIVSVSKQAGRDKEGNTIVTHPKTENSVREVSIPQEAVELLIKEHNKHPSNPYMFPSPKTGQMYHPDSVVNLHKKFLKRAGLPHIPFHSLRHTFATVALQNGVDVKTVSAMLGHFDPGFTLRTYTHATRQAQDDAAKKMGNFMAQII